MFTCLSNDCLVSGVCVSGCDKVGHLEVVAAVSYFVALCDTVAVCTFERLVKGWPATVCRINIGVFMCYEQADESIPNQDRSNDYRSAEVFVLRSKYDWDYNLKMM